MGRYTDYIKQLEDEAIKLDEGFNRDIIIQPSKFTIIKMDHVFTADYEWIVGNKMFYLFSNKVGENVYEFKFTDEHLNIDRTGEFKKAATSVFSGAILAIKEFLSVHFKTKFFIIDVNSEDLKRISIYRRGLELIARECNAEFKEEEKSDDKENYIKFIFQIKE